ncbi:MAG: DNA cytosine methyltransferase, partial [Victivallaceae bacterium]
LAYRTGARIVVFENVPGILSSGDGGSDFAGFLSLLCGWEVKPPKDGWRKCGIVTPAPGCFGVAWRILDAQYTRVPEFPRAVPQRRRRLILVGHLGSWIYPAKVLFDGEMRGGDTPPRRAKRQGLASGAESGADPAVAADRECIDIRQIGVRETELSPTLIATDYKGGKAVSFYPQRKAESMVPLEECSNTLVNGTCPGHQNAVCFENHGQDSRIREIPVAPTVSAKAGTGGNNLPLVMDGGEPVGFIKNDAGGEQQGYWTGAFPTIRSQVVPAVAIAENVIGRRVENGGNGVGAKEEVAYTQNCTGVMGVCQNATVRRLLPVECERLMGFPDNHTRIPWKGKPEEECPDAPRYKACGNSMCVNVMAWVGRRIQTIEDEFNIAKEAYAGSN